MLGQEKAQEREGQRDSVCVCVAGGGVGGCGGLGDRLCIPGVANK